MTTLTQKSAIEQALTIVGRCVYCGCSDPQEPMVHCYEHDIIVRLYCSDIVACGERQEREALSMTRDGGRAA